MNEFRQGEMLPQYPFVIVMKVLSCLLNYSPHSFQFIIVLIGLESLIYVLFMTFKIFNDVDCISTGICASGFKKTFKSLDNFQKWSLNKLYMKPNP